MKSRAQLDQRRQRAVHLTLPSVGLYTPAMIFSSVLLPEPLRPIRPTVWAFWMSSETLDGFEIVIADVVPQKVCRTTRAKCPGAPESPGSAG